MQLEGVQFARTITQTAVYFKFSPFSLEYICILPNSNAATDMKLGMHTEQQMRKEQCTKAITLALVF